eukprot:SAG22_NODE_8716_length_635_cov_1.085821_1_plen_57_part_01
MVGAFTAYIVRFEGRYPHKPPESMTVPVSVPPRGVAGERAADGGGGPDAPDGVLAAP